MGANPYDAWLPLLKLVAARMRKTFPWLSLDELMSHGFEGLHRGLRTWKEGQGTKISTHLGSYIAWDIIEQVRIESQYRTLKGKIKSQSQHYTDLDVPSTDRDVLTQLIEAELIELALKAKLTTAERYLLKKHYLKGVPLWKLAKHFGVSSGMMTPLKKSALAKCRTALERYC